MDVSQVLYFPHNDSATIQYECNNSGSGSSSSGSGSSSSSQWVNKIRKCSFGDVMEEVNTL